MNSRIVVAVLSALLSFAGCHSYRVAGSVKEAQEASVLVKGRYHLREIKFDVSIPRNLIYGGPMANPNVPVQVASQMDDTRIREFCEKRWPEVFSPEENGTAIDVTVTATSPRDSYSWTFFFPCFLSLGVLPGGIKVESDARVNVKVNERHLVSSEVGYVSNRMSAFSAFGVIGFSRNCGQSHVVTGQEVLYPYNPKTLEKMAEEIFCETFADAVRKCLSEFERSHAEHAATQPAAKPDRTKNLSSSVESLKKLRADGIITEKEYQEMVLRAVEKGM